MNTLPYKPFPGFYLSTFLCMFCFVSIPLWGGKYGEPLGLSEVSPGLVT